MEIQGNSIIRSNLVGEVKSSEIYPNTKLVQEIEAIMNKYKIDYMWFAWSKFGATKEALNG